MRFGFSIGHFDAPEFMSIFDVQMNDHAISGVHDPHTLWRADNAVGPHVRQRDRVQNLPVCCAYLGQGLLGERCNPQVPWFDVIITDPVNTAASSALISLPGIGPSKAAAIIASPAMLTAQVAVRTYGMPM